MKWFKHDVNARNDIKLRLLKKKFGLEGYGVYFSLLEIIGEFAEKDNVEEWGYVSKLHTTETLAEEIGTTPEKLEEVFQYCNELELFTQKNKRLYCEKILTRLDEYATKIKQQHDRVGTKSRQSPKKVVLEEEQEEEQNKNKNILLPKKFSSLKDITPDVVEDISQRYGVAPAFVNIQLEKLTNWTQAKGKNYKDYRRALMNWVLSEIEKNAERRSYGTSKVSIDPNQL